MDETSKCIIQPVSENHFLLYSYGSGLFYLCDISSLPPNIKGRLNCRRVKLHINCCLEKELITSAINPNSINISVFKSPVVVGVMTVNYCNLACKYCISANGNGYSNTSVFPHKADVLFDKLMNSQIVSVLLSGGEPTLYDDLPFLLRSIAEHSFLCLLDTNGIQISDDLLNALTETDIIPRVSLDSSNEYEHNYNRGDFKKTVSTIDAMIRSKINLRVNTVLNSINLYSLENMAEWLLRKGIKKWHIYKLQKDFAPCEIWVDDKDAEEMINSLLSNYSDKLDILCKFSRLNDGYSSFIIDGEGNCFSTSNGIASFIEKVNFGNIYSNELSEIWENTPLEYRRRHLNKYLVWEGKRK